MIQLHCGQMRNKLLFSELSWNNSSIVLISLFFPNSFVFCALALGVIQQAVDKIQSRCCAIVFVNCHCWLFMVNLFTLSCNIQSAVALYCSCLSFFAPQTLLFTPFFDPFGHYSSHPYPSILVPWRYLSACFTSDLKELRIIIGTVTIINLSLFTGD